MSVRCAGMIGSAGFVGTQRLAPCLRVSPWLFCRVATALVRQTRWVVVGRNTAVLGRAAAAGAVVGSARRVHPQRCATFLPTARQDTLRGAAAVGAAPAIRAAT